MKLVIDANCALEIVLKQRFDLPMRDTITESEEVVVPELYCAEVANALWKNVHSQNFSQEIAVQYYRKAISFVDTFVNTKNSTMSSLRLGCLLDHSIYDMYYLTLADQYDAHLMTLDKRLLKLAKEQGIKYVELMAMHWDKETGEPIFDS